MAISSYVDRTLSEGDETLNTLLSRAFDFGQNVLKTAKESVEAYKMGRDTAISEFLSSPDFKDVSAKNFFKLLPSVKDEDLQNYTNEKLSSYILKPGNIEKIIKGFDEIQKPMKDIDNALLSNEAKSIEQNRNKIIEQAKGKMVLELGTALDNVINEYRKTDSRDVEKIKNLRNKVNDVTSSFLELGHNVSNSYSQFKSDVMLPLLENRFSVVDNLTKYEQSTEYDNLISDLTKYGLEKDEADGIGYSVIQKIQNERDIARNRNEGILRDALKSLVNTGDLDAVLVKIQGKSNTEAIKIIEDYTRYTILKDNRGAEVSEVEPKLNVDAFLKKLSGSSSKYINPFDGGISLNQSIVELMMSPASLSKDKKVVDSEVALNTFKNSFTDTLKILLSNDENKESALLKNFASKGINSEAAQKMIIQQARESIREANRFNIDLENEGNIIKFISDATSAFNKGYKDEMKLRISTVSNDFKKKISTYTGKEMKENFDKDVKESLLPMDWLGSISKNDLGGIKPIPDLLKFSLQKAEDENYKPGIFENKKKMSDFGDVNDEVYNEVRDIMKNGVGSIKIIEDSVTEYINAVKRNTSLYNKGANYKYNIQSFYDDIIKKSERSSKSERREYRGFVIYFGSLVDLASSARESEKQKYIDLLDIILYSSQTGNHNLSDTTFQKGVSIIESLRGTQSGE